MDRRTKLLFTVAILFIGAVLWLALSVYPMDYGPVESSVLTGLLVLAGLFEFVLDRAVTGE